MAIVTDNFNRASLGSNWTQALGAVVINSSTRATGSVALENDAFYNATSFTADQYSQIVVETASVDDWVGVCVRASTNNTYVFYGNSAGWELDKFVSNNLTIIASGSWTLSAGDVLRLDASGTTLTGKRNGSTITTQTDSSHSSGAPGVAFWSADAIHQAYGDNWEGGDLYNELIDVDVRFMRAHPAYRM